MLFLQVSTGSATYGNGMELDVIAAIVLAAPAFAVTAGPCCGP